ncbi:hypothetical protein [Sphingobacterium sp. xlx-130]|uniref:hypothetical protein n=1 Tax=Sphingobacterium sp. xlx-130 TaxID=2654323 RepID=UPI0013DCC633|nr:hypothetical protein [Sphingobacterium sp. xlx-130]
MKIIKKYYFNSVIVIVSVLIVILFLSPFNTEVWGNVADWIQAICAITMVAIAFLALTSWKNEKKLEYEAEAITKSFESLKLCKRILDIGSFKDEFLSFKEQDSIAKDYPIAVKALFLSIPYDRMVAKYDDDIQNLRTLSLKMKKLYNNEKASVFYRFYDEINEIIKNEYDNTHRWLKMNTSLVCLSSEEYYRWVYRGVGTITRSEVDAFLLRYPEKKRIEKLERLFVDVHFNEGVEVISKAQKV